MSAAPRDGTSQAGRVLPELDPDYARVDERTSADLIAFARRYAEQLRYFAPGDPDQPQGTWSAFIGEERAQPRPHLALFLAFLELLGHARAQLNTLTRRHLEFFYRDVLRMVRKPALPDRVHVLVDLDEHTTALRLPAGSALRAGKDSLGRDLAYRTERELIANRVEVDRISALRVQIRRTGIRAAARQHLVSGTREDAFVEMLKVALGQPAAGDPLPVPAYPPGVKPGGVDFAVLRRAYKVVDDVATTLGMPLFDDLRTLMRLKALRQKDGDDWASINGFLQQIGQKRDAAFRVDPKSTEFQENLRKALGKTPPEFAKLYDDLPEVRSIEDAYALYPGRDDIRDFIEKTLALPLAQFARMMQAKTQMEIEWSAIHRLLEEAGRRKQAGFQLVEATGAADRFAAKFDPLAALEPKFAFDGGIDPFFKALLDIERYFAMSAESFKYIMAVALRAEQQAARTEDWSWHKVYEIVAAAHREMGYAKRRAALRALVQADGAQALENMLGVVLGEKAAPAQALRRLQGLGVSAADVRYLGEVAANAEASPDDWTRAISALEVAQRNREGLREPLAEKVEWRNLYPTAEARAAPRWKTFGAGEENRKESPAPPATLGWAASSPLLALAEGTRTIELRLGFPAATEEFVLDPEAFGVELSTAKGWLAPPAGIEWAFNGLADPADPDAQGLRTLALRLTVAETAPALVAPTRAVHGMDGEAPMLRLMLKPKWQEADQCYVLESYPLLRRLALVRARLDVTVAGLAKLSLANDQGTLDAKKPFEPFGAQPAAGARLYLGHPEIVDRQLDTLTFNITWMGAPADLKAHYANYPIALKDDSGFTARVSLADGRVLTSFSPELALFGQNGNASTKTTLAVPEDPGSPAHAETASADVTEWSRSLVVELLPPDFQHSAYAAAAFQKTLDFSAAIAAKPATPPDAKAFQVNPPYTPKIRSLTLDYTASTEDLRVQHVHPFGHAEVAPEGDPPRRALLAAYDFEGELYIGLRNAAAPQNVALLFQVAEGSADPDLEPAPVQWSFLSGNRWLPMDDGSLLADGTRGLINSGIVELALRPAQPSTLLPGGLYWIRAAIERSPEGVCEMVEVHPNAVAASFADAGNAPDHLAAPLPAGRIGAPVVPIPGIAGVRQPYTSFGGRMAEQDAGFYVRVSERLRHKERALTAWDYERLVLEKFPQLYKVKCLHADAADPGRLELVVIPDIRDRRPFNPFGPKAPADLIRDIEAFVRQKAPPVASVTVKNPHYVPVKVRCGVRFVTGQDEGFCRRRLNEELNRFLSPWAYAEGADLVIGGSVYGNSIINFIDDREYVDYIFEFKLFTREGTTFEEVAADGEGYRATAKRRDAVLVAFPEHELDVTRQADYRVEEFSGVNYMQIGLDFLVS